MEKLIVTAAIIGNTTTRSNNPNVPITPKEIADSAVECFRAGATVCHIHVRDPLSQGPSMSLGLFREVYDRIRDRSDMIVNLSTGLGGRLFYDLTKNAWDFSQLKDPEERVAHVLDIRPEICSLDIGTLNFGPRAFINLTESVEKMAIMIRDAGIKPELEVFDVGNLRYAKRLVEQKVVLNPPLVQLCLGIPWGIDGRIQDLLTMYENLPEDTIWSAFGVGKHHYNIASSSIILGGHVRVGFEDNVYIKKNVLAESNAEMVRKVIEIANLMDREVANVDEARRILGLNSSGVSSQR